MSPTSKSWMPWQRACEFVAARRQRHDAIEIELGDEKFILGWRARAIDSRSGHLTNEADDFAADPDSRRLSRREKCRGRRLETQ